MVKDAWDLVASSTIQKCWKCIVFSPDSSGPQEDGQTTHSGQQLESPQTIGEILQAAQIVDAHVTADDVSDWLSIDAHQDGYENYSDEQIIQQITDGGMSPEVMNAESDNKEDSPPCSNRKVVDMADMLLRWAEYQPDTNPCQLMALQQIRSMAIKKITHRQTTLDSFFINT